MTQVAAITASILTIIELGRNYFKPMSSTTKKRSVMGSVKILLANTGSILLLVFMVLSATIVNPAGEGGQAEGEWAVFVLSVVLPVLSSVLNPIIYVILTPSSRKLRKSGKKLVLNNTTAISQHQ